MADGHNANDGSDFETVARLTSAAVPVAGPDPRARQVREALAGQRYESASHIAVCDEREFLGIVTIESLLAATADARMGEIVDRDAPRLTPGADQELAAWHAVRSRESALTAVDRGAASWA